MNAPVAKLKVAILGTGNIGTDLLIKSLRSQWLQPTLFVGRNLTSAGMVKAHSLGVPISDQSINAIADKPGCCDLVFDATSAADAKRHAAILRSLGKTVIDLTPAKVGEMCVPAVNLGDCDDVPNINMVTCGGQASIPIAFLIGQTQSDVQYVEVVSSIASRSAGPATRRNIDEYVETTEKAIMRFTHANSVKAILILNPAEPCIDMQTTIFATVGSANLPALREAVSEMVANVKQYVPGYELVVAPILENGRIVVTVKVQGLGDYLPKYAGNLDIINCAAIAAAEQIAKKRALQDPTQLKVAIS